MGVVLCGGKSTRMGTDKGLIKTESTTWAQLANEKLSVLGIPVGVSINREQYEDYQALFPSSKLILDNEGMHVKGPLLGIVSAHCINPHEDLLVLASDMPLINHSLLQKLVKSYQENSVKDAFVYVVAGEVEPLCGIYTARCLSRILNLYQADKLSNYSMKFILEKLSLSRIEVEESKRSYFSNINTKTELQRL